MITAFAFLQILLKKFDININNKKNISNRYPSIIKYNDSNSIVEDREVLYRALAVISFIPLLSPTKLFK